MSDDGVVVEKRQRGRPSKQASVCFFEAFHSKNILLQALNIFCITG